MIKGLKTSCVLAVTLLMLLLPKTAFAKDTVPVEITVGIQYGGTAVIDPKDGAPTPNVSELTLRDGEVGAFHIDFEQVGNYVYSIIQEPGTQKLTYDTTVYDMQVCITNEGDGLGATINVYNEDTGEKVNSCVSGGTWSTSGQKSAVFFANVDPSVGPTDPEKPTKPEGPEPEKPSDSEKPSDQSNPTDPAAPNDQTNISGVPEEGESAATQNPDDKPSSGSDQGESATKDTPMTGSREMEHYLLISVAASAGLLLLAVVYTVSTNRLMGR